MVSAYDDAKKWAAQYNLAVVVIFLRFELFNNILQALLWCEHPSITSYLQPWNTYIWTKWFFHQPRVDCGTAHMMMHMGKHKAIKRRWHPWENKQFKMFRETVSFKHPVHTSLNYKISHIGTFRFCCVW